MSEQATQFLMQILPIAAGALFVLVSRGVKLPESGIQVRFSGELPDGAHGSRRRDAAGAHEYKAVLPVRCEEIRGSRELGEVAAIYRSLRTQHPAETWHGYSGDFEDMHDCVFGRLVYDELITNGIFSPKTDSCSSHQLAFERLSILDEREAGYLDKYLKRQKSGKLRLFACGSPAPLRHALSFDSGRGFLLAYLVGYDLEVIGV